VSRRFALLALVALCSVVASLQVSNADVPEAGPIYDISWPQCPENIPQGSFSFAIIGLNNGRPFSTNDCFMRQYRWAQTVEAHPDVYINLDYPKPGRKEAMTGPYGRCTETDEWCRAYNYGYALAKDSVARATEFGVTPGRYWFDVEMINYWSPWQAANGQVIHGAVDYFLDMNLPMGIYATRYQWGLITGHYVPTATVPLWVAGATNPQMARERCSADHLTFAGGVTWMVQYYPEDQYDGNVLCPPGEADRAARASTAPVVESAAAPAQQPSPEPLVTVEPPPDLKPVMVTSVVRDAPVGVLNAESAPLISPLFYQRRADLQSPPAEAPESAEEESSTKRARLVERVRNMFMVAPGGSAGR
jgi:hypothetical protein